MLAAFWNWDVNPVRTLTGRSKRMSSVCLLNISKSMPNPLFRTRLTPKLVVVVFSQLRFSLPKEVCPTPGTIVPPKLYP